MAARRELGLAVVHLLRRPFDHVAARHAGEERVGVDRLLAKHLLHRRVEIAVQLDRPAGAREVREIVVPRGERNAGAAHHVLVGVGEIAHHHRLQPRVVLLGQDAFAALASAEPTLVSPHERVVGELEVTAGARPRVLRVVVAGRVLGAANRPLELRRSSPPLARWSRERGPARRRWARRCRGGSQ
jgi:hypothetical protein